MYYKKYLLGKDLKEEQAFLAGCRAMMAVFAHTTPKNYSAVLSRDDPDWILLLCTEEERHQIAEREKIAAAMTEHYDVDKEEFRGLLLNRARVNDKGEDVDEDGNVCKRQTYPYQYYINENGTEITVAEFERLPPEEQARCEENPKIKLYNKFYGKIRLANAYNNALMKKLLIKIIPNEPEPVLRLYEKALEDESNELVQTYRKLIKPNTARALKQVKTLLDFETRNEIPTSPETSP